MRECLFQPCGLTEMVANSLFELSELSFRHGVNVQGLAAAGCAAISLRACRTPAWQRV